MNQISVNESVCKKVKQIFYVFIRVIFSQNLFNIILVHGPKKSAKLNKVLSHLSYLNKCQSQFFYQENGELQDSSRSKMTIWDILFTQNLTSLVTKYSLVYLERVVHPLRMNWNLILHKSSLLGLEKYPLAILQSLGFEKRQKCPKNAKI